MLQQFTVENFLSFKEREVFKLQPGKGSRNKEHKVEPVKGHWILKSAALFGPNAGGKSNFVEALEFGKRLVLLGTHAETLIEYHPFRLSSESKKKDTTFIYQILCNNKKYEYSDNNKIDRTGHTYIDYLSYMHKHPGIYVWQLDFLGAIKTDNNNILSFILPNLQFTLLDIINNPDSNKVVNFFDRLEERIGTETFIDLIPVVLTDRDPCFTDIEGICFSKITGEERCKLFFCDPYVSNQKPNVENINKQLRLFFPKKSSIDKYTKSDIKQINYTLLNKPLKSLDSYTPRETFIKVFDEDLFNKLF